MFWFFVLTVFTSYVRVAHKNYRFIWMVFVHLSYSAVANEKSQVWVEGRINRKIGGGIEVGANTEGVRQQTGVQA